MSFPRCCYECGSPEQQKIHCFELYTDSIVQDCILPGVTRHAHCLIVSKNKHLAALFKMNTTCFEDMEFNQAYVILY